MKKYLLIDSEYCSMGRWISAIVADALNMKLYEGKDLAELSDESWLTADFLREFDCQLANKDINELKNDKEFMKVYEALSKSILKAVEMGPCIIHERAAGTVLKDSTEYLKVLLYNTNIEHRCSRVRVDPLYSVTDANQEALIEILDFEDLIRKRYHDTVSNTEWGKKEMYDLCLDSDLLSREKCAEILIEAMKDTQLDLEYCQKVISKSF